MIALTLDENGIPETAQGRFEIAKKIVDTAATYGIPKHDIIVDALAHDHQHGWEAAAVTLETCVCCGMSWGYTLLWAFPMCPLACPSGKTSTRLSSPWLCRMA